MRPDTGRNSKMDVVFESDNIRFVKVTMELIPEYLEMVNDIDHVARFISDRRDIYTEDEEREYVQERIDNQAMMYSMLEKSTGDFIGNIEFFNRREDQAELGIAITAKMQDKGYGKEAIRSIVDYGFKEAGLKRITLSVFADNQRAVHVYEQCGFREYDRTDVDIFMEIAGDSERQETDKMGS